ncbi:uncharacterized protein LOC125238597 [Leguminivora glycinivorella]|uniref:uncharacterized protein LOC125238597 n=1 Tax=Leguminivora glycinivorella TaxID=1035111 RepID=UPI00200C0642|nr:uncharacterized protein LOC125238597 [Leguminivora glycinivorella]
MEYMEENADLGMAPDSQANRAVINSLNVDCWRIIFGHLTVQELMQTEATCRDWQKLVLDHMSYRQIVIQEHHWNENTLILRNTSDIWPSFKSWLKKCGPWVYKWNTDCQIFEGIFDVLKEYCPNLTTLRLSNLKEKLPLTNTVHFQKLTRLILENCDGLTDDCINQFLSSEMTDLFIKISDESLITGSFLNNLKTDKLNSLALKYCNSLNISVLLSCAERLKNLTTLKLSIVNRSDTAIRGQVHLILDKMPNLEEIEIDVEDKSISYFEQDRRIESDVFYYSVIRLKKLRKINANFSLWGYHLGALAYSCKDLTSVRSPCNNIDVDSLAFLCETLGPQLCELNLSGSCLLPQNYVACVYACPKLMWLDVSDCVKEVEIEEIAKARRDMRANLLASKYASEADNNLRFRLQLVVRFLWDFDGSDHKIRDVIQLQYSYDELDDPYDDVLETVENTDDEIETVETINDQIETVENNDDQFEES